MVFQKKVCHGTHLDPWEGGACRIPQRVLCGGRVPREDSSAANKEADDPRKVRPHELLSPHGG